MNKREIEKKIYNEDFDKLIDDVYKYKVKKVNELLNQYVLSEAEKEEIRNDLLLDLP